MKRSIAKDKLYKAIGKGERTSHKVSYITKADGSRFRRENANQHGNAEGGNDYVENRPNRTDLYPKDRRKKIMETGGKTPEEIAYEQEQEDAMFNSQYGKGSTVKGKGVSKIYNGDDFEDWIYENHPTFDIDTLHLEEFLEEHYQNMLSHNENFKNLQEWLGEGEGEEEEQEYAKGSTVKGYRKGGVMGDIYSIQNAEQFKQLITTYNELSEKFGVLNYFLDHKDNSVVFLMYGDESSMQDTVKLQRYVDALYDRGFDLFDKTKNKNITIQIDNSQGGGYVYFKLKLSKIVRYAKGGKTPEEAYEQEQYDAMYDSTYGKGGKTGCWCYSIGGL
jgi:hypothetical protein